MSLVLPAFSIIIPTFDRPDRLSHCLQALARLDYSRERFEIIVVDDGSPSPPIELIQSWKDRLPLKLIVQNHGGPALARNTGAAAAGYPFLAFTDDDCAPEADWLSAFAIQLSNTPDRAIGGQIINALTQNPFSTASQDLVTYLYSHFNADPQQARFFTSNNLVVPADRFQQVGGFDQSFPLAAGEDRDFCDRWLSTGYGLTYAPDALVYHAHALSLRTFWQQHFNYGRGAFHFHRLRSSRRSDKTPHGGISFYINLAVRPFMWAQLKRPQGWAVAGLTLLAQLATAFGLLHEQMATARPVST